MKFKFALKYNQIMENTVQAEVNISELNERIERESAFVDLIKMEMQKVI